MNFQKKLEKIVKKNNSLVCVGLDSDFGKIPSFLKKKKYPLFEFNKAIIDKTFDLVCAYKPNSAFYEELGAGGISQLKMTCDYINKNYPDLITILDAKRGDIGNTNNGYVKFAYHYLGVDAITFHPYLGEESLIPFLEIKDKGIIILCRTSNKGAGEFQDLQIKVGNKQKYLYQIVADRIINKWNKNGNCLMVVGATYPKELHEIRQMTDKMIFLVPGIGSQGGDVEKTVKAGLNSKKSGLIISSSRGIIFASSGRDFAEKARSVTKNLQNEINSYR